MKKIVLILTVAILASCANTEVAELPEISVKVADIPIDNNQLYVVAKSSFNSLNIKEVPLKEVPFEPHYLMCGGVYSTDEEINELLEKAELIYTFSGVSEAWTPINGKPKEYYVFTIKFK